jgi:hypothetical protein
MGAANELTTREFAGTGQTHHSHKFEPYAQGVLYRFVHTQRLHLVFPLLPASRLGTMAEGKPVRSPPVHGIMVMFDHVWCLGSASGGKASASQCPRPAESLIRCQPAKVTRATFGSARPLYAPSTVLITDVFLRIVSCLSAAMPAIASWRIGGRYVAAAGAAASPLAVSQLWLAQSNLSRNDLCMEQNLLVPRVVDCMSDWPTPRLVKSDLD